MKIKLVLILLFLVPKVFFSQSTYDKKVYLDSLFKVTSQENSKYYRIIKDYHSDKNEYRFEDYYKSGKIQMEGNSLSKDNLLRSGDFVYYYDNGNKEKSCSYEKDRPNGNTLEWYANGSKKLEGEYIQNPAEYSYDLKINQYWDSNSRQIVVDGNGELDIKTNKTAEAGKMKNGWKDGVWKGKNDIYKCSFSELYENGILVNGTNIDSLNVEHKYKSVFLQPRPNKGMSHFYKFVAKNFKIPKKAYGINGKIILEFVVNKNGSIDNVTVVKSLEPSLDEEAKRVISKYPDWSSGEFRGIKARVSYSIPIVIKS